MVIDSSRYFETGWNMAVKKIAAMVLLLLGAVFIITGILGYNKSRHPNGCVVDFSRSLGGKASLALKNSTQRSRYLGISVISGGVVFTLAGCVLLFKSKK